MNTFQKLGWVGCAIAMAGCAATPNAVTTTDPAASAGPQSAYVSQVEREAKRRGIHVHWVNPPDDDRSK